MNPRSDRNRLKKIFSKYNLIVLQDQFLLAYEVYAEHGQLFFFEAPLYRLNCEDVVNMSDRKLEEIAVECAMEAMVP